MRESPLANRTDTFNRTDSTTTINSPSDAAGDYVVTGTWGITGNAGYIVTNTDGVAILDAVASPSYVEVTMPAIGADVGIILRAPADKSSGIIVCWSDAGNVIKCCKRTAGSATFGAEFGANISTAIADGDTIKVEDTGTAITVYVNTVSVGSFTGGADIATYNIANTYAGLFSYGNGTGTFDSLTIAAVASMSIDRSNILCGSGTVTVTLTGSGTSWTGSPFSLTGAPSGWSISSQNVASGTSATVTLNKGSGTGAFSITDGTLSDTLTATNTATSAGTGNWGTAATWDVIERPVSGNLAVIAAGHTVTCAQAEVIGNSPAEGNTVLTIAATATLIVDTGDSLTIKGKYANSGTFQTGTASGGATLEFDASGASSPSSQQYEGNNATATALFKTMGTEGSHSVVRSNSGGGNAYLTGAGGAGGGLWDCEWTDFLRIGDATNSAIEYTGTLDPGSDVMVMRLVDCTFTDCGRVNTANSFMADAEIAITRVIWVNTQHADHSLRMVGAARGTGVTRAISLCAFDKQVFFSEGNFSFSQCVFDNEFSHAASGSWAAGDFDDCFVRFTTISGTGLIGMSISGDVDNCYFLADGGTNNPHGILPRDIGSQATLSNTIYEYTKGFTDDTGDWFYGGGDWIVEGCILLAAANSGAHQASGALNFPEPTARVRHCTLYVGEGYGGGILLGDGNADTDTWLAVENNIFWCTVANQSTANAATAVGAALTVDNVIDPDGCQYNGLLNINVTAAYKGDYPTTQPGANDVRLDATAPTTVFVDPARNFATWAVSRGSVGATFADKVSDGRSYLRADPTLIQDLMAYVRYGFRVQYGAWRTASSTGNVLGAVQDEPEEGEAALFWWGNYGNACY